MSCHTCAYQAPATLSGATVCWCLPDGSAKVPQLNVLVQELHRLLWPFALYAVAVATRVLSLLILKPRERQYPHRTTIFGKVQ